LQIADPHDRDRDRFVLGKGHAALALYAAFYLKSWLTQAQLNTFCGDDTLLGVHPEHSLPGVEFSTGSLGQSLSMATGAALAARLQKSSRRVFALLSDAECNEGAIWEAVMFAAHHKLANLIAIIDLNGQQAFGYTEQVLSMSQMGQRWQAFGWDVHEVDGHDVAGLKATIKKLATDPAAKPHVLVAHTTFGKGVSYMENLIKWHYLPMSDDDYRIAMQDIANAANTERKQEVA
jgi:transketolase